MVSFCSQHKVLCYVCLKVYSSLEYWITSLQRHPHAHSKNLQDLHSKWDLVDVIEWRVLRRDYSGPSWIIQVGHCGQGGLAGGGRERHDYGESQSRVRDLKMLHCRLWRWRGATSQALRATSRSWKRPGNGFLSRAPEGISAADTGLLSSETGFLDFWPLS